LARFFAEKIRPRLTVALPLSEAADDMVFYLCRAAFFPRQGRFAGGICYGFAGFLKPAKP
jgi:hypothetical protein